MGIYTKKGDGGKTYLINSKKPISKDNVYIRAIGSLDEVNSYLGVVKMEYKKGSGVYTKLEEIQRDIITISSIIAGAKLEFPKDRVLALEKEIDKMEEKLSPLTHFILPKGHMMYARAVVRRAEREVVGIKRIKPEILKYLNRLSDYLFMETRTEEK